jgi:hypothetical protein
LAGQGTKYGDRAISVLGLVVFQFGFWATSKHRSYIQWRTVIVGLFFQQAIALFVLKSGAGFHMFKWLATLASDFLDQGLVGATFFFDQETVNTNTGFSSTRYVIVRAAANNEGDDKRLSTAVIARYYHFLYRIRANALLSWGHAVDHQALRLVLLQDYECIRC